LKHFAVARAQAHLGVGDIEFVHATGDADIEKPALLLKASGLLEASAAGEHPVRKPNQKNHLPLKAFGLMQGRERDLLLFRSSMKGFGGL